MFFNRRSGLPQPEEKKNRRSKLFLGIIVISALSTIAGIGANLLAETDNQASVVSTGALVLSNTKQGGTTCFSTDGPGGIDTNINENCDQLISLLNTGKNGQQTARVTLKNEGSVTPSKFVVFSPTCVNSNNPDTSYNGDGDLCDVVEYNIQSYTDASFTTKKECVYGGDQGTQSCTFNDQKTLANFSSTHGDAANALSIAGGLAPGQSGFFEVQVRVPDTIDNTYMGRQAAMSQNWVIQ